MCEHFGVNTPTWAQMASSRNTPVPKIRNDAIHEALFMKDPLGFAVSADPPNDQITDEMRALVCRLLAALLGAGHSNYLRTPVNTGQKYPLHLC